jgi:septum formation protein
MPNRRLYLASQSPRRRELLHQIGVPFDVLPLRCSPGRIDVIEIARPDESPRAFAERMAREKSRCGWQRVLDRHLLKHPVLGADTLLDLDGEIIGKPASLDAAVDILQRLSGREHWVHTAVAVTLESSMDSRLSSSKVRFARIDAHQITRYLRTGEALDKAGAYGIQGHSAVFVEHIEGSHSGIVGLPLFETAELLRRYGYEI